jgi:hypothetical protein
MAAGLFDSQMTQVNQSGEPYGKYAEDSRQNIVCNIKGRSVDAGEIVNKPK